MTPTCLVGHFLLVFVYGFRGYLYTIYNRYMNLIFFKLGSFQLTVNCWFGLVVWIPGIPI